MSKQYLTLNHKLVSHSKYGHKYGTKLKNLHKNIILRLTLKVQIKLVKYLYL